MTLPDQTLPPNLKAIRILMAEDNDMDVFLVRAAFEQGRLAVHLDVTENGVDALAFLRGEGRYAGAERPDLVMLDINMPRMDGLSTLKAIRADPALRTLPVVMLTTSDAESDVLRSYENFANAYIVKPISMDSFFSVVRTFEQFWFSVVRLPRPERAE
ncbi:response regulator [Deinococcus altitudinis]|uniref:response regulator n=1 Tax=Deinococcus altitudinis TaxID=468914 RepID=UPI0038929814